LGGQFFITNINIYTGELHNKGKLHIKGKLHNKGMLHVPI